MVMILSIRSNISKVERDLDDLAGKQLPYAQALAVNALAGLVQTAERQQMKDTFDGVTPFTLGGVKISKGRKSDPTATIYLGDIAEQYLAPYISGGRHFLGRKRGILNPKNVNVNRYGNLAAGKLAALKSRSDVFVGRIKTKDGKTINGVFQRGNFVKKGRAPKGSPRGTARPEYKSRLKILIRFGDSLEVTQHLDWYGIAQQILDRNVGNELDIAMKAALATARP